MPINPYNQLYRHGHSLQYRLFYVLLHHRKNNRKPPAPDLQSIGGISIKWTYRNYLCKTATIIFKNKLYSGETWHLVPRYDNKEERTLEQRKRLTTAQYPSGGQTSNILWGERSSNLITVGQYCLPDKEKPLKPLTTDFVILDRKSV